MAAIATKAHVGSGFFSRLAAAITSRWQERAEYDRTLNELRNLSDRELDDIGISRFDIQAVARGAVKR